MLYIVKRSNKDKTVKDTEKVKNNNHELFIFKEHVSNTIMTLCFLLRDLTSCIGSLSFTSMNLVQFLARKSKC